MAETSSEEKAYLVAEAGHEEVGEVASGAARVGQLPVHDHHPNPPARLSLEQQVVEVEVSMLTREQRKD